MPRYTVEGVVLKAFNYKDADKILTIFSREKGKISATAKGVRKISSRRAGNLDTLNHVKIGVSESRSGFKIITEAETLDSFKSLKETLKNSARAYYILELVHKLTGEDHENPEVFGLLIKVLKYLSKKTDPLLILTYFEIFLLHHLGYGVSLDKCVVCKKDYTARWKKVKINYNAGGFVCDQCAKGGMEVSEDTARILNYLSTESCDLTVSLNGDLTKARDIVKVYVQDILEEPPKSPRVFGSV